MAEAVERRRVASNADITQGNIWKRVLLYVLPLMAASLFQQLYTVVDAFVVGNFVGSVPWAPSTPRTRSCACW